MERAEAERFYGEMVIRWENGSPVIVEVHQKFKPKDFEVAFQVLVSR